MTDREMLLAWKGGSPLTISREDLGVYLIADRAIGNGGSVRCVRVLPRDSSDADARASLKLLAEDLLIAEAQFPQHLAQLGKLSHGI